MTSRVTSLEGWSHRMWGLSCALLGVRHHPPPLSWVLDSQVLLIGFEVYILFFPFSLNIWVSC